MAAAKKLQKSVADSGEVIEAANRFTKKSPLKTSTEPGRVIEAAKRFNPNPNKVIDISTRRIIRREQPTPRYAHGKASAQAVLDAASAVLKSHWDPIAPKLENDFAQETKRVLLKLGIKNVPDETISEIAKEAVDTSLDALSTIQSPEQIGQALADGLARTISANIPDPNLQQDKIYEQVLPKTEEIKTENAPELETAASLGNIILTLSTSPSAPVIADHISQIVEEQVTEVAPLASAQEITNTQKSVDAYTENYQQIFADQIQPILESQKVPSLEQLQAAKEQTYAQVIEPVPAPHRPTTIAAKIATSLGLKRFTAQTEKNATVQKNVPGLAQTNQQILVNQPRPVLAGQKILTLETLQAIKERAHARAIQSVPTQTNPKNPIDAKKIATKIATSLSFKPFTAQTIEESGLGITRPRMFTFADAAKTKGIGVGIGLSTVPQVQASTFNALITNNGDFNQNFLALTKRLEELEKAKKSGKLSRHEKLERKTLEEKVRLFSNAKKDEIKNPKKIATIRSFFQDLKSGNRLVWASSKTQEITDIYSTDYADITSFIHKEGRPSSSFIYQRFHPQINKLALRFAPQAFLSNPNLLADKARGALGVGLGGLPVGNLSSIFKNAFSKNAIKGAMGMNPATGFARKLAKVLGAVFGGLGAYFLMLGQAAFTGFVIGAGIGLTTGAIFGAAIPVMALGPAGILLWPVTVPLGAFAFGIVGGLAGGLIALGLASGSATMVSTGVGAGIGGVIGAYAGFLAGTFIAQAFLALAIVACTTTLIGCVLVPIAVVAEPVIILTSMALGAITGAIIGGFGGYLIGNFVLTPISNLIEGIGDKISGASSGVSGISIGTPGFLGTMGGWFTSAGSWAWNGLTGAGEWVFGHVGSAIGSLPGLVSGLGSAAVGSPVITTIVAITAGAAFFSLEAPIQNNVSGDNQYYTINKTADKTTIPNSSLPQDVTFTITLTAKALKLTSIQITDEMSYQNNTGTTQITQDNTAAFTNCQNDLEPNQTCTATITINVTDAFKDSRIINIVKVTATPEGKGIVSDSKTATVAVGSPPSNCFTFDGNWTESEKTLENNAITQLARSQSYISLLCSTGNVQLRRVASDGYNFAECPNIINISDKGVGTQTNTTYVLAHESGHILQCAGLPVFQNFLNNSPWLQDGYICSYPLEKTSFEDFAESIAVYVVWHDFTTPRCGGSINYPTKYPDHYNFAKTNLFGGFEY